MWSKIIMGLYEKRMQSINARIRDEITQKYATFTSKMTITFTIYSKKTKLWCYNKIQRRIRSIRESHRIRGNKNSKNYRKNTIIQGWSIIKC